MVVCDVKRFKDNRAQVTVEFALILPVLLIIVLGILDLGRALNVQSDETHLANEAVRYAAVDACSPCGAQMIDQYVTSEPGYPSGITLTFCYPSGTHVVGDPVRAIASKSYSFLPTLVSWVGLPTSKTITSTATMRIEQTPSGAHYTAAAGCP